MYESACLLCSALQLIARGLAHRFRAPICTHIRKNLGSIGQKLHEKHAQTVQHIIFRSQNIGLSCPVPVEGSVQHGLREITVGIEIRPLSLSLKTGGDGVVSYHLFFSSFRQIGISVHQILDDAHHLYHELPVLVLLLSGLLYRLGILVEAFLAVFLHPPKSFLVFLLVVNALSHAAYDLHLVNGLHPHAQIFFDESGIDDGAADAHADRTDLQVGFAPHGSHCHRRPAETQQLLLHVLRNGSVVRLLHIMTVDAESRKPLLGMGGQHGCQINRAGTLRSVEAPHALYGLRLHVHSLRAVAPAGRHGQRDIHSRLAELVRAGSSLPHPSDGGVRDNHLHRLPVGIAQILRKERRRRFGHVHGLLLQRLPHLQESAPAVDGGADSDHGIIPHKSVHCHIPTSYTGMCIFRSSPATSGMGTPDP